jgi:hypothetical protein
MAVCGGSGSDLSVAENKLFVERVKNIGSRRSPMMA